MMVSGLLPNKELFTNRDLLYIAIGIIGATVMPHNLYLHSALVQTRAFKKNVQGKAEAIKFASIDSTVALVIASLVNAAILIVSASTFHFHGINQVAEIQDAHRLLTPLLGTSAASFLFAIALLASGHNSTITGTLAGQVVMEGFVEIKLKPWQRRLLTRLLAIVPSIFVVSLWGTHGLASLLVLSQVVLSIQLPFAVIPLVLLTSNKTMMKSFVNPTWLKLLGGLIAVLITILNLWLIKTTILGVSL
jgi:manganese transport protein